MEKLINNNNNTTEQKKCDNNEIYNSLKPNENIMLSPHFSLREMTLSGTAIANNIDNTPGEMQVDNMRLLCEKVLEPLRKRFGKIRITSGYRSEKLNAKVGGSATSQHMRGEAADIHVSSSEVMRKMVGYIVDNMDFDQLITEHAKGSKVMWLHVSYSRNGNRKMTATLYK